jgi:hypothetical protein
VPPFTGNGISTGPRTRVRHRPRPGSLEPRRAGWETALDRAMPAGPFDARVRRARWLQPCCSPSRARVCSGGGPGARTALRHFSICSIRCI